MRTLRLAVVPLRIMLALTFAALLVAELMSLPGMFAHWSEESPEFDEVRWPLLIGFELGLVCVQVVIACIWRLLTLVGEGRVFSDEAIRWVDVILAAIGVAWALLLAFTAFVFVSSGEPGNGFAALLVFLPGTVFALLMVVMRALLLQATELRTDMEAVI